MFGRFGRKILGDEFWSYFASRKRLEVISFILNDVFNFKLYKIWQKIQEIHDFTQSYDFYHKNCVFFIFLSYLKLKTSQYVKDITSRLFLETKYDQNSLPKIFRLNWPNIKKKNPWGTENKAVPKFAQKPHTKISFWVFMLQLWYLGGDYRPNWWPQKKVLKVCLFTLFGSIGPFKELPGAKKSQIFCEKFCEKFNVDVKPW